MRTRLILVSIAAAAAALAAACSDQERPTSPLAPRSAAAGVAQSTDGLRLPDASAAPAKYLKQIVYVDSTLVLQAGYARDVDVSCPTGTNVIGGGFWQISSGALPYTKVIRSGTFGTAKWRVEFSVDAASPVGAPVEVQAICVGY
jgi:hypothetical protein